MATDEEIVQRLTALESLTKEVHDLLCAEDGLVKRMRETELHQAETKKEMEIRQNWMTVIGGSFGAALAYISAYFTIK